MFRIYIPTRTSCKRVLGAYTIAQSNYFSLFSTFYVYTNKQFQKYHFSRFLPRQCIRKKPTSKNVKTKNIMRENRTYRPNTCSQKRDLHLLCHRLRVAHSTYIYVHEYCIICPKSGHLDKSLNIFASRPAIVPIFAIGCLRKIMLIYTFLNLQIFLLSLVGCFSCGYLLFDFSYDLYQRSVVGFQQTRFPAVPLMCKDLLVFLFSSMVPSFAPWPEYLDLGKFEMLFYFVETN